MADTASSTSNVFTGFADRPLPHNAEAEAAVLGSIMLEPATTIDVAGAKLNFEASFYNPANQEVFAALMRLASERPRSSIDLITLSDALRKAGRLEAVGGQTYLGELMYSVPTAANIEQYVEIVHQSAVLRRLIRVTVDVMGRCFDPQDDVDELLDDIEREVLEVTGLGAGAGIRPVSELMLGAINYLDKLHSGDQDVLGLQTGYEDLDALLTGLRPGEMTVLAARPSIGKTAFALNIVLNLALREKPAPVGFFSLEMSAELLVLRLLCSHARVGLSDIRDGALSQARWQTITEAGQRLRQSAIYIDDTGGLDIIELRAKARRMKREYDIQLLVIDYLQLLRANVGRNATRENEVARMSGGIKTLAKELSIPIMVLAQLNRQAEQQGQRPRLSHLRESGAIEQDADVVALLHREREVESATASGASPVREGMEAELIIAKHRNGPTGIVPLTFIPAYTRFESRSRYSDEEVRDIAEI